jgi:hypothetical protein
MLESRINYKFSWSCILHYGPKICNCGQKNPFSSKMVIFDFSGLNLVIFGFFDKTRDKNGKKLLNLVLGIYREFCIFFKQIQTSIQSIANIG